MIVVDYTKFTSLCIERGCKPICAFTKDEKVWFVQVLVIDKGVYVLISIPKIYKLVPEDMNIPVYSIVKLDAECYKPEKLEVMEEEQDKTTLAESETSEEILFRGFYEPLTVAEISEGTRRYLRTVCRQVKRFGRSLTGTIYGIAVMTPGWIVFLNPSKTWPLVYKIAEKCLDAKTTKLIVHFSIETFFEKPHTITELVSNIHENMTKNARKATELHINQLNHAIVKCSKLLKTCNHFVDVYDDTYQKSRELASLHKRMYKLSVEIGERKDKLAVTSSSAEEYMKAAKDAEDIRERVDVLNSSICKLQQTMDTIILQLDAALYDSNIMYAHIVEALEPLENIKLTGDKKVPVKW